MGIPLLTPFDVQQLRSVDESAMLDRCQIQRQDLVKRQGVDVPRDPAAPWPVVASDIKVSVKPSGQQAREGEAGGATVAEGGFVAKFPVGTDIRSTDRIRVTTDNDRIFKMTGRRDGTSKAAVVMSCEEI